MRDEPAHRHQPDQRETGMSNGRGMAEEPKRGHGRPVKKPMPGPIPDSRENIMRDILATPPRRKYGWKYLEREG